MRRISTYGEGKIIKKEIIEGNSVLSTSNKYIYDSLNRLIEYQDYSFGSLSYKDIYEYSELKIIKTRLREDKSIIGITEIRLDSNGIEKESAYYTKSEYKKILHSIYYSDYDKFGNLKLYEGYFYPAGKLRYKTQYFYSTKSKIDSSFQFTFYNGKLNLNNQQYYEYDSSHLLIKEIFKDIRNNETTFSHYNYK